MNWEAIGAVAAVVGAILAVGLPGLSKLSSIDRQLATLTTRMNEADRRETECRTEVRETLADHAKRLPATPPRLYQPDPIP